MRVIAKKRCRVMVEPPEKGERATLNPNLSTRLNLLFSIRPLDGGLAIAGRGGERRCKSAATMSVWGWSRRLSWPSSDRAAARHVGKDRGRRGGARTDAVRRDGSAA